MTATDVVAIDTVRRAAKDAAERGLRLHDACPWPFASAAGLLFKQEFFFHKAALDALAKDSTS